jgi:hypothetical protein
MENFIPDWVLVLLIVALFVVVAILIVLLFSLRQEQQQKQESVTAPRHDLLEGFPVRPVATPVAKPRIKVRRKHVEQTKFRRRQILGTPQPVLPAGTSRPALPLPVATQAATLPMPAPPQTPKPFIHLKAEPNGNAGPKIKRREIKIEFDAIHKVTGLPIRDCRCEECQEMRANGGT